MKISVCRNAHTYIFNQHIPLNAWFGKDTQSWWFCTVHGRNEDGTLTIFRFNGVRWIKVQEISNTTQKICAWADAFDMWWTKVYWFKKEDKQISLVAKQYAHDKHYENLMRHDRKHKKGGSGMRLDRENYYANKTVTDYECRKKTIHDFRKFYN